MKRSIVKRVLSLMLVLILFGLPICNLCFAVGDIEANNAVLKRSYSDSNICIAGKRLVFPDNKSQMVIIDTYNDMLTEDELSKRISYDDILYEKDLFKYIF